MINQKIIVYLGRNSEVELPIFYQSSPMDFIALGITKVGIEINGVEYTSDDGYIDFSANNGAIKIKLGALSVEKRKYTSRLIIYSPTYPKGKVIFSEKTDNQISVEFV